MRNLIDNAIRFSRVEGKGLQIKVEEKDIIIQVRDQGVISPMDLPRVFEKFYRGAQQSTQDQRGTGLGLSIVKSIVEKHGGSVWAESELGKGSAFFISIPLRQARHLLPIEERTKNFSPLGC